MWGPVLHQRRLSLFNRRYMQRIKIKCEEELTTYTYGHGVSLHALGKLDEACAAKGDAVKLARQQYNRDPKAHREHSHIV